MSWRASYDPGTYLFDYRHHRIECWNDTGTDIPTLTDSVGPVLRDRGLERTLAAQPLDWVDDALVRLAAYARDRARPEFCGEDFRHFWACTGRPPPTSHHAWGALFRLAARRGLIVATGKYVKAKSAKTHAHAVMVWKAA